MTSTTASEWRRGGEKKPLVAPALTIRSLAPLLRHRHRGAVSPAPRIQASCVPGVHRLLRSAPPPKAGLERPVFSEGSVSNRDRRNRRPPPNHSQELGCRAGWRWCSLTLPSSRARARHTHTQKKHARWKVRALPKLRHACQRPYMGKF